MELIAQFIDIVLHLEKHLSWLVQNYGTYVYAILFAIIFCETGLVITPFLPGDSLLFVAGTLAATGHMDVHTLFAVLCCASFLGDNTNYWVGRFVGPRVFRSTQSRLLNRTHLEKTHRFYEKHGGKTIVIARFMPIVRTFAPLVAGVGRMEYRSFLTYNVVGGLLWIWSMLLTGWVLARTVPGVAKHVEKIILLVVFLSILPGIIAWLKERKNKATTA